MAQLAWASCPFTTVAIPARNEAKRITACLLALEAQSHRPQQVLLLINNTTDATETIARALQPRLSFPLRVVTCDLPASLASAGHARRLAMQVAAERLGPEDILLTTDADGEAPRDWVALNLQALGRGADVVCGRAVLHAQEAALLPPALRADEATEARFIALLDAMTWALDPEPHDPHPRHTEASGASLAVTVRCFAGVGGIPPIADGEDRSFVRALWLMDTRVRHDPAIHVAVSGRLNGRATAGMAATLRRRMLRQDDYADPRAEPAEDAWRRSAFRRRVRSAWRGGADPALARDLEVAPTVLAGALRRLHFGRAWDALESISPTLRRRRVPFTQLPREIAVAEALLSGVDRPETLAAD